MRSRVLLLATAVLLVTGGAAAQAVFSEPDAAPAPRKRASVAEPDAADAAAAVAPAPRRAAPAADDAVAAAAPAAAAGNPVSAVADAGGSEEPQGLRPKTQLATKYEPGLKILNDEGLPLVDRYVAGSLVKSVKDSGGNTICEMVLQGPTADNILTSASGGRRSLNPGNRPLLTAYIACRGPKALVMHAGPALAPFAANFSGVEYIKEVQLPGGAIEIRGQDVTIENSFFVNLNYMGKAAIAFSESRASIINSSFVACNNSAAGALYANDSSIIRVLDSTFTNNGGGQGGAINVQNSSLIINGTTFLNNTSRGEGGGVAAVNATVLQVYNTSMLFNTAKNGGGLFIEDCGRATFFQNTWTGNLANKAGGALWQTKCSGDVTENSFRNNRGGNAGSIWQNACKKITLQDNVFVNNTAYKGCAGVEMNQCNAEISFNKFAYGKSEKGGGLYLQGVVGDIRGCVFENNAASFGGGVFRGSSTGNLVDSTFKGNRAKSFGGGLYDSHVSGDVAGCKFTGNKAARGAALFRTESKGDSADNKGVGDETAVLYNPSV